jgi:hypothetical protein
MAAGFGVGMVVRPVEYWLVDGGRCLVAGRLEEDSSGLAYDKAIREERNRLPTDLGMLLFRRLKVDWVEVIWWWWRWW